RRLPSPNRQWRALREESPLHVHWLPRRGVCNQSAERVECVEIEIGQLLLLAHQAIDASFRVADAVAGEWMGGEPHVHGADPLSRLLDEQRLEQRDDGRGFGASPDKIPYCEAIRFLLVSAGVPGGPDDVGQLQR